MSKSRVEQKLDELGLTLPVPPVLKGINKSCVTAGSRVFVSGHVSNQPGWKPDQRQARKKT